MERKLIRNKLDFIQLYKSYKEEEYKNIQEDNIAYPSEYPCNPWGSAAEYPLQNYSDPQSPVQDVLCHGTDIIWRFY